MFGSIRKLPTECPHCGFVQNEPAGLISTYCRGCGDHYTVAAPAASPAQQARPSPLARLVRQKLLPPVEHRIVCHKCHHPHDAGALTETTSCPACGASITLHDVEILGHSTRIIQTRGTVHVGRDGFLNSTRVICGSAFIEGRIAGKINCEGTLRIAGSGLCRGKITARRLLIDRGVNLRFTSTLQVGEIIVRGHIEADVECVGTLHIGRYGGLTGDVQARAMVVDKGGLYVGEVQVSTSIIHPAPEVREEREIRVQPGWQAGLAFG